MNDKTQNAPAPKRVLNNVTGAPEKGNKNQKQAKVAPAGQRPVVADDDNTWKGSTAEGERKLISRYTYRLHKGAKDQYGVQSVIDYTNCTMEEILQLANQSVVIKLQDRLRKMGESGLNNTVYATVDVKTDIIDAQRQQADENVKLIALIAKKKGISKEEAAKIAANM